MNEKDLLSRVFFFFGIACFLKWISAHFYDGVDVRLFIFLVTLPIALNVIYVFYGGSRPALDFRAKTVLVWFDLWARGIGGGLLLRARGHRHAFTL